MKDSTKLFKLLGFLGIGLCVACCAIPIVAVVFGIGAITALSGFLEWGGIAVMILVLTFFVVSYFKKRRAPSCEIDCASKEEKILVHSQRQTNVEQKRSRKS